MDLDYDPKKRWVWSELEEWVIMVCFTRIGPKPG